MTGLLSSELLKLRTTRTFFALAGAALGLVLLVTVLTLALDDTLGEDGVRSVLSSSGITGLMMLVLGVVFGAGEYRHGTIASTLLVTPDRLRVVGVQALACGVAGVAVGLAGAALTAAIGLPWLAAKDAPTLSTGELAQVFGGGVLYTGLAAAFGAALGALMRNQIAAVVIVLVVLFVVDPTVAALVDGYVKYSLQGLGAAISGSSGQELDSDLLPAGVAALLWAGYTAVLVAGAAVLTSRRDI